MPVVQDAAGGGDGPHPHPVLVGRFPEVIPGDDLQIPELDDDDEQAEARHRRHDEHAALGGVAAVEGHGARSGRRYSAVASAKTTTAPRKPL